MTSWYKPSVSKIASRRACAARSYYTGTIWTKNDFIIFLALWWNVIRRVTNDTKLLAMNFSEKSVKAVIPLSYSLFLAGMQGARNSWEERVVVCNVRNTLFFLWFESSRGCIGWGTFKCAVIHEICQSLVLGSLSFWQLTDSNRTWIYFIQK